VIFMNIERPGMYSMFQDLGRCGHQGIGVSVNGPMDEWSHRLANALVGNPKDAAVLECTLSGPRASFSEDVVFALCGASMNASVNGLMVPQNCAVYLRRGALLDVGDRISGARVYLAVRGGGLASPAVLGSRSTNSRAGFGGFNGRALRKDDRVPFFAPGKDDFTLRIEKYGLQSGLTLVAGPQLPSTPPYAPGDLVRFVAGPHWAAFTEAARSTFTSEPYKVSPQSDRMGSRLSGTLLRLTRPLELISEATVFGTVQVPPDGSPIVLMADRQSAGGYPKIGYVLSADLPKVAQLLPGESLRFQEASQVEAERSWRTFKTRLSEVCEAAAASLT